MSTLGKPPFKLSVKYLGPIFSFDGILTKKAQNLIYARNGTGKSFLSRAFRYLDMHAQSMNTSDAAHCLVSDESPNGKGDFAFSRGDNIAGKIALDRRASREQIECHETIFHVFSEEFVNEQLRQREYEVDGAIENQIAVDSENI